MFPLVLWQEGLSSRHDKYFFFLIGENILISAINYKINGEAFNDTHPTHINLHVNEGCSLMRGCEQYKITK